MVTKGFKKKKSKRISSKVTRKVEKKVREHNRKQKKEAKKNPNNRKGLKKDPGVPNSLPFKEELLAEIVEKKRRDFEKKKKKKQDKANRKRNITLDGLVVDAQKRGAEFQSKEATVAETGELPGLYDNSLKAYYKEVKKVIEAADVILQILDARDPMGTRCQALEETILQSGPNKRVVLVLNKCDLIPKENVLVWLKYLRQEFPTIAFKASTQNQKQNLSHSRVPVHLASADLIKTSKCFGGNLLMKILGNYCRNKGISTAIKVGVVGLPNVGKSSVINSLRRKQTCSVGATPGVTKAMQEIYLDKNVTLLDSPGVLFSRERDDAMAVLRNAVKVESINDPVAPVEFIVQKCSQLQLMLHYKLPEFKDIQELLALLALKRGFLKKGGIADITKAARLILQDWVSGKISFYTLPPESRSKAIHLDAELVTTMSKEFDLDAMEADEKMVLDEMPEADASRSSVLTNLHDTVEDEEEIIEKNDTGTARIVVTLDPAESDHASPAEADWSTDDSTEKVQGNQQRRKKVKKMQKRRSKLKSKSDITASAMADEITSILNLGGGTAMEE